MKKTIAISLILLGCFLFSVEVSAAALEKLEVAWPNSPLGTPLNENTKIHELIKYVYEWGISLGGFAAFIVLVIAGFQYLTSAGNPTKMKGALDQIRGAALGLILLLGSVLILNTINPQLTQLKVPPFPIKPRSWQIDFHTELESEQKDCNAVVLYAGPNYQTEILNKKAYYEESVYRQIESLKIQGNCQLTLYRLNNYGTNADNPPIIISGDKTEISNMSVYGETEFRSLKIIELKSL